MKSILSAVGVVAISAGTAHAAQFQFLSFEAGGGLEGVAGAGFQASSGNFFKSTFNMSALAGPFAFFGAAPDLEFDTYFSIDPIGPSGLDGSVTDLFYGFGGDHETNNSGTPSALTLAPGSNITGGAAQIGLGVSPQPFMSGLAPDGNDGVFVMRATVDPGQTVVGGGFFTIQDGQDPVGAEVNLDGTTADFGGQELGLVAYFAADDGENGAVQGDTYDVWFQVIPTPGALALLGVAGVSTLRRRRR